MNQKYEYAPNSIEAQFEHLDIDNHIKDRLIWLYLTNRKDNQKVDRSFNEVDTDWENWKEDPYFELNRSDT